MPRNIRKPGAEFELTDEEILHAPAKLLSPAQRKRRRQLRNNEAKKRVRNARKERREKGGAKIIYCQGYTKKGEPCGAFALTGAKHCNPHLNDAERAKLGIKRPEEYRAEARLKATEVGGQRLSPSQSARQVLEVAVDKIIYRYFKAIGLEFQGYDEEGVPVVYDHGIESGLMLHGESKDGYIEMSKYPDLVAQIQVIEKLWDRVYGKPKQTQVLEGGVKPIQVQPVKSVERAQAVSALLHRTGAIPHEGRRRSQPTETHDGEGNAAEEPKVVPLRPTGDDEA